MKRAIQFIFVGVLVAMIAVTSVASLDRGVLQAWRVLWPDWWFRATLADAYFGFLTVYVWVAYRETAWLPRVLWAAAFVLLGNIAIAIYVLRALARLPADAPLEQVLLRPRSSASRAGAR